MVTFNELSYRIFNIIKPKIADDESIDILDIQYDVESTRALLLKRKFSNKFKAEIPEAIVQPLRKLRIEAVNASNVLPSLSSDKILMRTTLKIPRIIEKSSGLPLIKRISSSTLLSNNFTFVTPQQAIYSGNGKFNQKDIFCFYENDYLYFITGRILYKAVKYVDLYAVYERPTQVYDFANSYYNNTLNNVLYDANYPYSHDSQYPVSMDMIDEIESIVIKNKLKIEATQPIDVINDSTDTIKQIQ